MSWKQLLPLLTQCFEKPGGKVQTKKIGEITFNKKKITKKSNLTGKQMCCLVDFFFVNLCRILVYCATIRNSYISSRTITKPSEK